MQVAARRTGLVLLLSLCFIGVIGIEAWSGQAPHALAFTSLALFAAALHGLGKYPRIRPLSFSLSSACAVAALWIMIAGKVV